MKRSIKNAIQGLAIAASVSGLALGDIPSDSNIFVEVSSGTVGVGKVKSLGKDNLDFHVTTTNVPADFTAAIHVEPKVGELISDRDFTLKVGDSGAWRVRINGDVEREPQGDITLYRVDVEIGGVGEGDEVATGAFLGLADLDNAAERSRGYPSYRVPVEIKCWPGNQMEGDKIAIRLVGGDSDRLIADNGGVLSPAEREYSWGEVNGLKFWLVGGTASSELRDRMISVSNTVNACHDEALYTVRDGALRCRADGATMIRVIDPYAKEKNCKIGVVKK